MVATKKEKSRLGLDENILGGTGGHAGAPLTLVATVAESESLDDFCLLAIGTLADLAPLVAHTANRFDGLPIYVNSSFLSTRVANTLHNLTSFGLWVGFCLKKNEKIRPPDLTSYPILLLDLRQDQMLAFS